MLLSKFKNIISFGALSVFSFSIQAATFIIEGEDIEDSLIEYTQIQEEELNAAGRNYVLGYGLSAINGQPGTETYVTAISMAYQQALINAYVHLAQKIGADKIATETSANNITSTGNAESLVDDCVQKYKAEEAAAAAENESFIGVVKDAIKETSGLNDKEASAASKLDEVYECTEILEGREIENIITRSVTDVFSGTRVIQTVVHDGSLGVVAGFSPETMDVARTLKNQNASTNPISTAKSEIRAWVNTQVEKQTGSKLGLVGARMKKLSNGEWAVIGFGLAEASKASGGSSVLARQKKQLQRKKGGLNSVAELSRFSGSSIFFEAKDRTSDSATKTITNTLREGGSSISQKVKEAVISTYQESTKLSSNLTLKGASSVYSKLHTDANSGSSFYISAHAWSPSMLSKVKDFQRKATTTAAKGNDATSAPVLDEDW
jgi:hypothetical protein